MWALVLINKNRDQGYISSAPKWCLIVSCCHPISGLPHRIIIYPAALLGPVNKTYLVTRFIHHLALCCHRHPLTFLNLLRHLTICLAQNFAPLTFPVPAAPGHRQIITDDDEYWTKLCTEPWMMDKWSPPTYFWPQLPDLFVSCFWTNCRPVWVSAPWPEPALSSCWD